MGSESHNTIYFLLLQNMPNVIQLELFNIIYFLQRHSTPMAIRHMSRHLYMFRVCSGVCIVAAITAAHVLFFCPSRVLSENIPLICMTDAFCGSSN